LDIWIASAGVLAGLLLLALAYTIAPDQYGISIAILVTSGSYLLFRKPPAVSEREQPHLGRGIQLLPWVVRISTGCTALLAAVALGVSYNSLGRPAWIIIALSIVPAFILLQVLLIPKLSKELEVLLLLQVSLLLAAIVLSSIYAFPYNGGDTSNHLKIAAPVRTFGTIKVITGAYGNFPLYPATTAAVSELLRFDLQHVLRLINMVGALAGLLALYGLSRAYHSAQQSLILALLAVGSLWFVYWNTFVVSMNTALWLFCILVSIVLKRFAAPLRPWAILTIFALVVSAPFFHPLGAAAVVMLFGVFAVLDLSRSAQRNASWRIALTGLALLTTVVTLTQWMYYGTTFASSVAALANAISGLDQPQLGSSYRDPVIYNLDQINLLILYSLAGWGVLNALRTRQSAVDMYTGVAGFGFAAFGYLMQVLGIDTLVGHRWLLFATILLVFPASSALYSLTLRRSLILNTLLVAGVIVFFAFGIGSTTSSRDGPLYGEDFTILYELTDPEYAGLVYLRGLTDDGLSTDQSLCYDLTWYYPAGSLNCWTEVDLAEIRGRFTFRSVYLGRPLLVGQRITDADLSFMDEQGMMLLYDSGDLKLFERDPALRASSE